MSHDKATNNMIWIKNFRGSIHEGTHSNIQMKS